MIVCSDFMYKKISCIKIFLYYKLFVALRDSVFFLFSFPQQSIIPDTLGCSAREYRRCISIDVYESKGRVVTIEILISMILISKVTSKVVPFL